MGVVTAKLALGILGSEFGISIFDESFGDFISLLPHSADWLSVTVASLTLIAQLKRIL